MNNIIYTQDMSGQSRMTLVCVALLATLLNGRYECNAGWVDPDTPEEFHTISSDYAEDTREYELVRYMLLTIDMHRASCFLISYHLFCL